MSKEKMVCECCGEEYAGYFMKEDEQGAFCIPCGLDEGWIDKDYISIDKVIAKKWGIVEDGREPLKLDIYNKTFDLTVDSYHFIKNMFEITTESQVMQEVLEYYLKDMSSYEAIKELAQDFNRNVIDDNTYNYESILSNDFTYHILHKDEDWVYDLDTIIIIEWHYGQDIRAGYTSPLVVTPLDLGYFIMGLADAYAHVGQHCWTSDNGGYSWGYAGNSDIDIPLLENITFEDGKVLFEGQEVCFSSIGSHGF